jgi:cellulose synthase/poly-beta-1,6-N-acetylglucosamine synthase-like glycosyltransferase
VILDVALDAVVAYYVALHVVYGVLIAIGATQLRNYRQGIRFGEFQAIASSPYSLPFSVIVPAYNEARIIVGTVENLLLLRYPQHEVVVVSDGSTDATVQVLIDRFNLRRVPRIYARRLDTAPIRGVYESPDVPNLVVVDKENGQRADAINAGVNVSRWPMLCIIDADCVLEEDVLLHAVRPFLRDRRVVAAGGVVRPANGLVVDAGRIVHTGVPRRMLPLVQAIEYLRSFQWARLGLARLQSMLCISGAFMIVRKDVFVEMGGVDPNTITDDIEFTVRLNRYVHEHPGPEKPVIRYVPDAVCYTEVPETHRVYASQRNRWQRGTLQTLFRHWRMTFNPRYGATGLFGMPFFFVFEAFSAVVEGAGYVLIGTMFWLGRWTLADVGWMLGLYVVLGLVLSMSAVLLQETTRLRPERTADLARLLAAAMIETVGYHQLHLVWRVAGTFDYLVRRRKDLGLMERYGSYQRSE